MKMVIFRGGKKLRERIDLWASLHYYIVNYEGVL